MVKELLPCLYRIHVPLPESPLKYLNSYVIKASPRSLIIDTGMNREECLQTMKSALSELDIDLNKTDIFITHIHADHIGLAGHLATENSKVYFNRAETFEINSPGIWWQRMSQFAVLYGFPPDELSKLFQSHPATRYRIKNIPNLTIMKEGDLVEAGDYSFRCIETPGHSPGHLCLYDARKRLLVSGDHILKDITSNITTRYDDVNNALGEYLHSLDKIYPLDIALALPGHRNYLTDVRKRINELKEHHRERASEQLRILSKGEQDAYQVTTQMTWDMKYEKWDEIQSMQKYFAFAEGLAHLQYLTLLGKAREKKLSDGRIVYSLS
ncbi:MAG: MBL fold metallo-hydrolase [Dehalococcoidales bacterium]|nr:MBL fold metallo-hydrolase [Dehalococcoidales bacterium]